MQCLNSRTCSELHLLAAKSSVDLLFFRDQMRAYTAGKIGIREFIIASDTDGSKMLRDLKWAWKSKVLHPDQYDRALAFWACQDMLKAGKQHREEASFLYHRYQSYITGWLGSSDEDVIKLDILLKEFPVDVSEFGLTKEMAEAGDIESMSDLSQCYRYGIGSEFNDADADKWDEICKKAKKKLRNKKNKKAKGGEDRNGGKRIFEASS
jgi:hypothetical protein